MKLKTVKQFKCLAKCLKKRRIRCLKEYPETLEEFEYYENRIIVTNYQRTASMPFIPDVLRKSYKFIGDKKSFTELGSFYLANFNRCN